MAKRYKGRAQRIDNLQYAALKADEALEALIEAGAPAEQIDEARRAAQRAQRELEWSLTLTIDGNEYVRVDFPHDDEDLR